MIETYIPLYRKYRPQQFSDLVGQEVVSTAIGNAISLNKIAHAYLFCGPRGTGKTSSARIFAKSLNCEQGPTITPCQTCTSCVAITQGTALDVTEIDAASNNSVDDIRDLTDKVQFSPIQGKFKVYIIDEVHMLTPAAFNALLKTLEEPPPNVVFVFATTEPHKVLPTIISRCQRFDFSRITRTQIEARLAQVADMEGIQIVPEALTLIARHVKGGLRDALGLLDQVSVLGRSESGRVIQLEDVRAFIGNLEEDILFDLTQGILDKAPDQILGQMQVLQERGVEPVQLVKELTQHVRNLLIAKTCGPQAHSDRFEIAPDVYARLCTQADGFAVEEIPQMLTRLSQLEGQLRHSQQPQLWLEVGLLDLCYRQEIYLLKQLSERVAALENALSSGQMPMAAPARPQPMAPMPPPAQPKASYSSKPPQQQPANPPTSSASPPQALPSAQPAMPVAVSAGPVIAPGTSDLPLVWHHILESLKQHRATIGLLKDHFCLLAVTENSITIGYTKDMFLDMFKNKPDRMGHLEQAVQAVFGKPCALRFEMAQSPQVVAPEPSKVSAPPPPVMATENVPVLNSPPPMPTVPETVAAQAPEEPEPANPLTSPPLTPTAPVTPQFSMLDADDIEAEVQQAKKYTQELLQGRMIE